MIAYRIFRALGQLALRWYYRDIEVRGLEHLPDDGPALVAGNHPNALVDALVIGCTLERPVTLTAKATLLDNPITRVLLRLAGVVPLRRASDVRTGGDGVLDPSRNANAFSAVLDTLAAGGLVLLFPEGKSHSEPSLAPLKTGLARIAIMAHEERNLLIPMVPIGLTFERKWEPRSRVLMQIGTPIVVTDAIAQSANAVEQLTDRIDAGLRQITLNFRTADEARRIVAISSLVADLLTEFRPLGAPDPPLANSVDIAQRAVSLAFEMSAVPSLMSRVDAFLQRLDAFQRLADEHAILPSDIQMKTDLASGVQFAVRETVIASVAIPLALFGRVNHWLPLRIARNVAHRLSRTPDEPAMNTIVAGLVLVLAFYAVQISIVTWQLGWLPALAYAVLLPISASWDFRYADRIRRGIRRIRGFLQFRRDPALQAQLLEDARQLREEAVALDSWVHHCQPADLLIETSASR